MHGTAAKALLVAAAFAAGLALSALLLRLSAPEPVRTGRGAGGAFRYGRIVCMSPATAEIAFALGAGERVVGVSQYTQHPPEALKKPTCGGFFNPNYELILALRPDLVLTQGRAAELERFARENGLAFVAVELTDLASIFAGIERIGALLELEDEAAALKARLRARLAAVRARVAGREPVAALLVSGREPGSLSGIHAVGPDTFLHDLIVVAGGRNVFADLGRPYGVVNKEAIIERAPQVIVELHGEGGDARELGARVRALWRGLGPLPAVRAGRVHAVEATYAMVPGPRVVQLAERLADLFHPEAGP